MSRQTTRERMRARYARASAEPARLGCVCTTGTKVTDLVLLSAALGGVLLPEYLAQTVHDPGSFFAVRFSLKNVLVLGVCWMLWTFALHLVGVYQEERLYNWRNLFLRLYTAVGLCSVVSLGMLHFRHADRRVLLPMLIFLAAGFALLVLSRGTIVFLDGYVRPHFRQARRAIIVGTDERAEQLAAKLDRDRNFHYDVVGFVDPGAAAAPMFAGRPILGAIPDLEHLLMREHVDEVLVALPIRTCYEQIRQVLALCEESGVRSQYFSDLFPGTVTKRREVEGNDAERVVLHMVHSDVRNVVKRGIDFAAALFGLLLLAPVFAVIALLIRFTSPGPVFFSQIRYGLNKRRFSMLKFRSMVPDAEAQQASLEHLNETGGPVFKIRLDPRITPIGRFLRKTSLDELPQLWNVLRGEMSLVGPRPLPMRDVRNFSELSLVRRFSVKPGMTGLWQVSGRSDTSFDGWIKLDLYYIDHWSLMMDARILARTLPAVIRGSGAS